ncbi:MAG: hypothetical protein EU539_07920 [Promethearchaeota archaeon]|nr:MAG: hypothetical protein EU539_07920 [Candidatus Lokiarchaeota archaeon]
MIKEIRKIFIIDSEAKPVYIRENYIQGSGQVNYALLSKFIKALQIFAKEYGDDEETRIIEMGGQKIFALKDEFTNFQYVMVCQKDSNHKKMLKILNNIKNLFIEKFMGKYHSDNETKTQAMNSFILGLNEILEPVSKWENLFRS